MLLYVMESKGSSPGRQGFFMAVNAAGKMQGSIGGGIMEHKFVEMAKAKLKGNEDEVSVRKQIHDKNALKNQSGMICSGEQTVLIYKIHPNESQIVNKIIDCLLQDKNGLIELSPTGLSFSDANPEMQYQYISQTEDDWIYREKIGFINHLHVIGAGHCSLAFCKIMSMLNFYIHLYDDRPDLNTFQENNFARQKTIITNYSELESKITGNDESYVVVMTFGYRTDDVAVRALLGKPFKYFGVLGSKKKIERMFTDYVNEGISEAMLYKIYAPVGFPIQSQTPEEIAVSIAAEIISVKNKQ